MLYHERAMTPRPATTAPLTMSPRAERALGRRLDTWLATLDVTAFRAEDPISVVRRYPVDVDRELVALLAALLAFGNVKAILASIERALALLGARPSETIDALSAGELAEIFDGFVHRVYRGADVAILLHHARRLQLRHGSIGRALEQLGARSSALVPSALARRALAVRTLVALGDALRGPEASSRGLAHLVPDARLGSACKRLCLFMRWMARPDDGVDLGLSRFPTRELVIPLDTHIHRIAQGLGLTRRRDASLRTAIEITDALARFDAEDPVRYDFVLCHLGIDGRL